MSDSDRGNSDFSGKDFIPCGESTPTTGFKPKWNKWSDHKRNRGALGNRFSRNDYGDRSRNNKPKEPYRERSNYMKDDITLYLQPAMLQDPWAHFTRVSQDKKVEDRLYLSKADELNSSKEEINQSVQQNECGGILSNNARL